MRRGRFTVARDGCGGGCLSSFVSRSKTGGKTSVPLSATGDTTRRTSWFVAVVPINREPSGAVFLQQSSEFAPGWHSPLRQQAAASRLFASASQQSHGHITTTLPTN